MLALDHSRNATGVALGSFELGEPRALRTLRAASDAARLEELAGLMDEWQPVLLVLGLPLDAEGLEQPQSRRVRRFAILLEQRFRVPWVFHDERWSTVAAEDRLRAAGRTSRQIARESDGEAAREILQGFFDQHKARNAACRTRP